MTDDARAHLYDLQQAAHAVRHFVAERSFASYVNDDQLRSAVERKFEIMGEALNRLRRDDPETLEHIRDYRNIISFRNILVHGYDAIDDHIVWDIIQSDLPALIMDVEKLLAE